MNIIYILEKTSKINILFLIISNIALLLLSIIAMKGSLAPISLFLILMIFGTTLIIMISKDEIFLKLKLFILFFSLFVIYTLINHYLLITISLNGLPYIYFDEKSFYNFSNLGLPYVSGEKSFFKIFRVYEIHELSLHVVFSSLITYLSILVDGSNTIIVQKMLSPFFGGMFSVVLYSTLKYQFKDSSFALKATIIYLLFSAIFAYSTVMLRDIDVALAYMVFFYLFLQKGSYKNIFFMFIVAIATFYLRSESGLVLMGLIFLNLLFITKKLNNKWMRMLTYLLLFIILLVFIYLSVSVMLSISGQYSEMANRRTVQGIAESSGDSIALLFNKLPFPFSYIAKVLFGQMKPFPFFIAIDRPHEAISGIFWPFIFSMMIYAMVKQEIRVLIDKKLKYLLVMAISILFLMSAEPMTRRMMSVYPIIYMVSLYTFYIVSKTKVGKIFYYYIFSLILLTTLYYVLKVK